MWEALPPFPRLPSRKEMSDWWRQSKEEVGSVVSPPVPSKEDISQWWKEKRQEDILPPLPKAPSPGRVARWLRSPQAREQAAASIPVPSPTELVASFKEQSRRRRRLILVSFLALVSLTAAGYFAGPPISRKVKAWQARRLAIHAEQLIDQQSWMDASKNLRSAFQLSPTEPESWRAYARMLSRTGQGGLAIEWWQKLSQTRPLSIEDRRDFAAAALASSELTIASEEVAQLMRQQEPTPRDILLAGQLATLRGYNATAIKSAEGVFAAQRATWRDKLGANLIYLSNARPESDEYRAALERLLAIARIESDPAAPQALSVLAQRGGPGRLTQATNDSLSIATPDVSSNAMSLEEIADRLDRNPNSRPFHRMLALELRARAEPSREKEFVERALKDYSKGDDETLIALNSWLYSHRYFELMLKVLPIDRAVQRRELLMERIDAAAALNRLTDVKELLLTEYPVLDSAFSHMYLAVVRAKLGETQAAENEWYRALDAANSPRALIGLADYAQKMGRLEIADTAYARLIIKQPGLKSGYLARLQLAEARGLTADAHSLAAEIVRLWPEDNATRVRELYLRLLLDSKGAQAAQGEEEAARLVASNPWDGSARTALALAQLRQGKSAAALSALTEFTPGVPSSAISISVYAAVLDANGWKDKAKEQVQTLTIINVLPEEKELIKAIR